MEYYRRRARVGMGVWWVRWVRGRGGERGSISLGERRSISLLPKAACIEGAGWKGEGRDGDRMGRENRKLRGRKGGQKKSSAAQKWLYAQHEEEQGEGQDKKEDCEDGDETAARIADDVNRTLRCPTPTRSKSRGGVILQCSDNIQNQYVGTHRYCTGRDYSYSTCNISCYYLTHSRNHWSWTRVEDHTTQTTCTALPQECSHDALWHGRSSVRVCPKDPDVNQMNQDVAICTQEKDDALVVCRVAPIASLSFIAAPWTNIALEPFDPPLPCIPTLSRAIASCFATYWSTAWKINVEQS